MRVRTQVVEEPRESQEILRSDQAGYTEYKNFFDQLAVHAPAKKTFRIRKKGDETGYSFGDLTITGTVASRVLTIITDQTTITVRWSGLANTDILFSPRLKPLAFFYTKVAPLFGLDLRSSRDEVSNVLNIPLPPDFNNWFSISTQLGTVLSGTMADLRGICAQLFLMGKLNSPIHFDIPRPAGVDTINALALYPVLTVNGELYEVVAIGYRLANNMPSVPHLVARVSLTGNTQSELLAVPMLINQTQQNALPSFLSHMFVSGLGITSDDIRSIAKPKTRFTSAAQYNINQQAWYDIGPSILLQQFLDQWGKFGGMTQYNQVFRFEVAVRSSPKSDTSEPYSVEVTSIIYNTKQGENLPGVNIVFGPKMEPQRHKLFLNAIAPSGGLSRLSGAPASAQLIQWILCSLTCQLAFGTD